MTGIPDLTYNVKEMLTALKENRTKHVTNFKEATILYDKAVKLAGEDLSEMGQEVAKSGKLSDWNPHRIINKLQQPENHVVEYDRAIDMLERCVEIELKLPQTTFAQLVQDKWDFSGELTRSIASNSIYLASKLS